MMLSDWAELWFHAGRLPGLLQIYYMTVLFEVFAKLETGTSTTTN